MSRKQVLLAGPADRPTREDLLSAAREAQSAFWEALSDLEAELECDVDANKDLEDETIESLLEVDGEEV